MSSSAGPSFVLRRARQDEAGAVYAFHASTITEHLWPRTHADIHAYAAAGSVYIAEDRDRQIAGLCYVKLPSDDDRSGSMASVDEWEFGGVSAREDYRGCGLPEALSRVALITQLAATRPTASTKLIAHVHEKNDAPRGLLGRLGFRKTDRQDILPPDAPASMLRNEHNQVIGHVFEFDFGACADLAKWLSVFDGKIEGRGRKAMCAFGSERLRNNTGEYIEAMTRIASGQFAKM